MELRTIGSGAQTASKAEGVVIASSTPAPSSQAPTQTTNAVTQAANIPNMEQIKQAAYTVAESLKSTTKGLEFEVDQDSQDIVVKIIDPETKEVIKQIPSKDVMDIAKSLDVITGRLIKATA